MKTFNEFCQILENQDKSLPDGAVQCQDCKGAGASWRQPYKVSPPRGNSPGGYEPNSNIKIKEYMPCDNCGGKGHHTKEDLERRAASWK